MIALLIALGALAVGKIHGQDAVASFVINSQDSAVSSNRRPAVVQEISRELLPPRLPSYQDRDRSELFDRNFTPSRPTENKPKTRISSVTKKPARMEQPSNNTNTTNTARSNARQKEVLTENISRQKQVQPVRPENENPKDNTVLPEKPTVVGPKPTTNVTVGERANFDGDQCPTGYVRVNGKCIEMD